MVNSIGDALHKNYIKFYKNVDSLELNEYIKISAGGEDYFFRDVLYQNDTALFEGSDPHNTLFTGIVYSEKFITNNDIHVGMNFENLLEILGKRKFMLEMQMSPASGVLLLDNHSSFRMKIYLIHGIVTKLEMKN